MCASAYPALHPHVPIQSPLVIEWVERNSGKTLAAARYHYWNPDAAVYDGRPKHVMKRRNDALRAGTQPLILLVVLMMPLSRNYRLNIDLP